MDAIPFLITIDTEGDNLWDRPREAKTRNATYVPRFQGLCEKYNLKPTYLTNFEMAESTEFREFGRETLSRDQCEIGMHIHAWDTPPFFPMTEYDNIYQPMLIDYPLQAIEDKVRTMRNTLYESFGVYPTSHRAGRWGMNPTYAEVLIQNGILVDCSITPFIVWYNGEVTKELSKGLDYYDAPTEPYWMALNSVLHAGTSKLLEVPLTNLPNTRPGARFFRKQYLNATAPFRKFIDKVYPQLNTLRPTGSNLTQMQDILDRARKESWAHVEFVLHSSELMPGGSPYFPDTDDIDKLYEDLETLFADAKKGFVGQTLTGFYHWFTDPSRKSGVITA